MPVPSHDETFKRLYQTHRQAIWSYCLRRVPRAEVEDAVAEVFAVAWRRRDTAPSGDETLLWLYGVARNVVRNVTRSQIRRRRLDLKVVSLGVTNEGPADIPVVRNAEEQELLQHVANLDDDEQELLRLRLWEELPIADIARTVGRSPRSVESKLARIRKKLARRLAVPASSTAMGRPRYAEEGGDR